LFKKFEAKILKIWREIQSMPESEEDEIEKLLEELVNQQLRANYRKALGSEHKRRYIDLEIEKIFKKKRDRDE
jgi:hypothetical protein